MKYKTHAATSKIHLQSAPPACSHGAAALAAMSFVSCVVERHQKRQRRSIAWTSVLGMAPVVSTAMSFPWPKKTPLGQSKNSDKWKLPAARSSRKAPDLRPRDPNRSDCRNTAILASLLEDVSCGHVPGGRSQATAGVIHRRRLRRPSRPRLADHVVVSSFQR